MPLTAFEALNSAKSSLKRAGIADCAVDAGWLLSRVLGDCGLTGLPLLYAKTLSESELSAYGALVGRREAREPLQLILGDAYFFGRRFLVEKGVLIPRADTETLCEAAIEAAKRIMPQSALDLCCGSGIVGITLALEGFCGVAASDVCPKAVSLAQKNADLHDAHIEIMLGDMFEPHTGRRFDMIVCNPPYISEGETLEPEVAEYDPPRALFSGRDGLEFMRNLSRTAGDYINPGGALIIEIGFGQLDAVKSLFPGKNMDCRKDLAGIDRALTIYY